MNFSTHRKVYAGFGIVCLIFLFAALNAYQTIEKFVNSSQWVVRIHQVREGLQTVLLDLQQAQSAEKQYLTTLNKKYLEPFLAAKTRIHPDLDKVQQLVQDNQEQQANLGYLRKLADKGMDTLAEAVGSARKSNRDQFFQAKHVTAERTQMDALRFQVDEMQTLEDKILKDREAADKKNYKDTLVVIFSSLGLAILISLIFAVLIDHEIQERQRVEQALLESEERFRESVDAIHDYAIFLLDTEGLVMSWNKGAKRIKGYDSLEIIGKSFSVFYKPGDVQSGLPQRLLAEAAEKGRSKDEGWRVRKDGSYFFADVVITALRDEKGELRGFIKVIRDMTEIREVRRQLKEKNSSPGSMPSESDSKTEIPTKTPDMPDSSPSSGI